MIVTASLSRELPTDNNIFYLPADQAYADDVLESLLRSYVIEKSACQTPSSEAVEQHIDEIRSGLRKQHGIPEPPEDEDRFDVKGHEDDEPSWGVKVSSLPLSLTTKSISANIGLFSSTIIYA